MSGMRSMNNIWGGVDLSRFPEVKLEYPWCFGTEPDWVEDEGTVPCEKNCPHFEACEKKFRGLGSAKK